MEYGRQMEKKIYFHVRKEFKKMKKTISLILTIFALCIFAGCESGGTEVLPTSETETQGGA